VIDELSPEEADAFLREQFVGRVGCHAGGLTYVVPIIYAWDGACAWVQSVEGQKVRMMRENPRVCLEVDEYVAGGSWRSVIVQGDYEELAGADAERATELLVERFGRRRRSAPEGGAERPQGVAFRIRARELTGRRVSR
jgi:nitroimidazol reductase NimA-like FMN-containing flavoprotein (pyridoxamine 5'-phosphate oxidase superfamily)